MSKPKKEKKSPMSVLAGNLVSEAIEQEDDYYEMVELIATAINEELKRKCGTACDDLISRQPIIDKVQDLIEELNIASEEILTDSRIP